MVAQRTTILNNNVCFISNSYEQVETEALLFDVGGLRLVTSPVRRYKTPRKFCEVRRPREQVKLSGRTLRKPLRNSMLNNNGCFITNSYEQVETEVLFLTSVDLELSQVPFEDIKHHENLARPEGKRG